MKIPAIFDLSGKVALVTGSTKGIGKAIAEQLAQAGAKVVVSSRKLDACEAVAKEINENFAQGEAEAFPIACNIGYRDQLEKLVADTRAKFGKIDLLICNAAVNPYMGKMRDMPDDAYEKTMQVNIQSNIWLCNMVCPEMAERKDGVIVIISSVGGLRGSTTLPAYAISKAADMQLVRNLAVEWGPDNIRANCIAPALVKTDFARALWTDPERRAKAEKSYPLARLGETDEIASMAVALCGKAGSWLTGQTIVIDGGMVAGMGQYS